MLDFRIFLLFLQYVYRYRPQKCNIGLPDSRCLAYDHLGLVQYITRKKTALKRSERCKMTQFIDTSKS